MRGLGAALFLALAASLLLRPEPAPRPERQYRDALTLLRNGDFAKAASVARASWQHQAPSAWHWRFRLVEAEALMEEGKPDEGLHLLEAAAPTSTEFEVRRRVLTARCLIGKSKFEPAQILLGEAKELASSQARADLQPEIDLQMALWFANQRKLAEAEAAFEVARSSAQAVGDEFRLASSANNLGRLRTVQFRWEEAIPYFEQAQQLWHHVGANQLVALADNNIVMCYSRLGDFDRALAYSQEALQLARPSLLLSRTLGETGTFYLNQQEPAKAIPYYRQARDMARQFGDRGEAARWAGNLTLALTVTGDWDGAEQALQEALNLGPEPRSLVYLNLDRADIARGRNQLADARRVYQGVISSNPADASVKWPAYAGIANTWAAEGNSELANRNFEAAIRVIEESQSDLSDPQYRITFLARLIRFYQDYVDALMVQDQRVKALAVADSSRARVLSQRFGRRLAAASPLQEAEFKATASRSGSIWLSYWLAPGSSFLWVTTPKEVHVFTLAASAAEIGGLVEEYRGFVESMRDPWQEESEAGRRLYEILIAPAASMIPGGWRVVVVPDGALHQLAFETLPVYGGSHPHYWIEDAAVSIAPSFGVFRGERQTAGPARHSLLIGDAVSPGPGFPRLEFAAGEIAAIEKHLTPGVTSATGEEARPDIWKKRAPGNFDIIHFAAHAEANLRSPLDSAIILSPGNGFRLYARDVIDVPLRANLVTLSACRSSGARTYAGEGLVGLTWAFLQAGSRNVVAGLWDVADNSTSLLMDGLYAGIAQGTEPAEALRRAQLDLLRTDYAKPYYWGAFQCYRR